MTSRARNRRRVRLVTSLGDLVWAIYQAVPGRAELRARRTGMILSSPWLGRRLSRPVRIVC